MVVMMGFGMAALSDNLMAWKMAAMLVGKKVAKMADQ